MKKILIFLLLLVSLDCFSQTTKRFPVTTINKLDSILWKDSVYMTAKSMGLIGTNTKLVSPAFSSMNRGNYYSIIQRAIDSSTSGTTIIIFPGIYTESLTMKNGVTLIFLDGAKVRNAELRAIIVPDSINCTIKNMELEFKHDVGSVGLRSAIAIGANDTCNFGFKKITVHIIGDGQIYDKDSTGFIYHKNYSRMNLEIRELLLIRDGYDVGDEGVGYVVNAKKRSVSSSFLNLYLGEVYMNASSFINFNINCSSDIDIKRVVKDAGDPSITFNYYSTTKCNLRSQQYIPLSFNVNVYDTAAVNIIANNLYTIQTYGKSSVIADTELSGIICNDTSTAIIKSKSVNSVVTNNLALLSLNTGTIRSELSANNRSKQTIMADSIGCSVVCNTDSTQSINANFIRSLNCAKGTQNITANKVGTIAGVITNSQTGGVQNLDINLFFGANNCIGTGIQHAMIRSIWGLVQAGGTAVQYITANYLKTEDGNYGFYNAATSSQYVNCKVINADIGRFSPACAVINLGLQFVTAERIISSANCIETYGNGRGFYDVKYFQLNNDSGHVIRLAGKSEIHLSSISFRTTSAYSTVYLQDTSSLYAVVLDTISNDNNASVIEVRINCLANIKASTIINNGSGASAQTVVWYGVGILKADEIRNLADSSLVIDCQSSNFRIKDAIIKGDNILGGIVALASDGLILQNCIIVNASAGSSIKSYSGARNVRIYGTLFSNYAKDANITFITGTETVDTDVQ